MILRMLRCLIARRMLQDGQVQRGGTAAVQYV